MAARREPSRSTRRIPPPATSPAARENQLIAAAYDLAEKQLNDGTASSQVITQFLKMGSEREKLERRRLEMDAELMAARVEGMASAKRVEELMGQALRAMKSYTGQEEDDDSEYDH